MKRVAMLLAPVIAVLGVALTAPSPALAARSLPRIQTIGMAGGTWHSGWRVRPLTVGFGSHFLVKDLRYAHYTQHSAYARGRLLVDNCRPTCAQGGHWVEAAAYFYDVFYHRGPGRNFGYLRLRWHLHSMLLWINSQGAWSWR